jgi:hypothetical protein
MEGKNPDNPVGILVFYFWGAAPNPAQTFLLQMPAASARKVWESKELCMAENCVFSK